MRAFGDTLFAAGIVALGIFVLGLKTGWSIKSTPMTTSRRRVEEEEPLPQLVN